MAKNKFSDDWLERLGRSEGHLGEAEEFYPEETRHSPKVSSPQTIDQRKRYYAQLQDDLQGHLFIPYYHLPAYNARFFDIVDRRSVALNSTSEVLSVTIPFSNAVLRWFGNDIEESAGFGNITWRIRINAMPASPWEGVTRQIGTIPAPTPIFLNLKLGDVITVDVVNASLTTAYTVLTRIKGWYW